MVSVTAALKSLWFLCIDVIYSFCVILCVLQSDCPRVECFESLSAMELAEQITLLDHIVFRNIPYEWVYHCTLECFTLKCLEIHYLVALFYFPGSFLVKAGWKRIKTKGLHSLWRPVSTSMMWAKKIIIYKHSSRSIL